MNSMLHMHLEIKLWYNAWVTKLKSCWTEDLNSTWDMCEQSHAISLTPMWIPCRCWCICEQLELGFHPVSGNIQNSTLRNTYILHYVGMAKVSWYCAHFCSFLIQIFVLNFNKWTYLIVCIMCIIWLQLIFGS
jgi:hypothetical protein